MPYTAGRQDRGDIQITYEPAESGGIQIELTTSLERLYGDAIRAEIENAAKNLAVQHGKFVAIDDGALPYVIRARVEAAIRLAKEGQNEG